MLCAGRHRVLPAPGVQGRFGRYSIVYFIRPEENAIMRRFESDLIPKWKHGESRGVDGMTVKEWIIRQSRNLTKSKEGVTQLD